MATSFDAPSITSEALSRNPDILGSDCGGDIDWSRGLRGLIQESARPARVSSTLLTKVIEGEIIPRLFLAHRRGSASQITEEIEDLAKGDSFAGMVLSSESEEIIERVEKLLDKGIPAERIFIDLLAPIARRLGEFWEEDRCTFTEVTLGLSRLHQVLHEVGRRRGAEFTRQQAGGRKAYFIPAPGEQHTFGLSMLEEFFLHAGWETAVDHEASAKTILATVATQNLDVVGFSISCKEFLDPLSDLIKKTRAASRNREIAVMVGGRIFQDDPGLAEKLGRATVMPDAVHAVHEAELLVAERASRDRTAEIVEGMTCR